MPYIDATLIAATMTAARYAELTTIGEADNGAIAYAISKTNAELEAILAVTYEDLDDCPDNIRQIGSLVGRYHLFAFSELVDKDSVIWLDYLEAKKHLKEIASGAESGLDDAATENDNPIPSRSRSRMFDRYLENWSDAGETQHAND